MHEVRQVPALPPRARSGHKGTYGTVLVLAGSDGMLGAAILAARSALRGGAGLVRACLPRPLMAPFTTAAPSATTRAREGPVAGWLDGVSAVVAGPGLGHGDETRRLVGELLQAAAVPLVLDADALNVLAPLTGRLPGSAPAILTPHPGEAARLLAGDAVLGERRATVCELARRSGRIAVLKGEATLVCDGERLFTNRTGNPGLATGGTGDVLAGLIGALLAQGMEPFAAACLGVHVHGKAGDVVAARLSEPGLIAEDLPLAIAELLR